MEIADGGSIKELWPRGGSMGGKLTSVDFRANAAKAVQNGALREALRTATDMFTTMRARSVESLPMETWRDHASAIRMQVLDNLPAYLDRFSANATRAGALVHRAKDAQTARDIVFKILEDHGARKVVKAKSMVTEEIHLNPYLQARGIEVVETDLGEYIVQIAGETPSHILAPAIHKSRRQIGQLFADKLGADYSDDPAVLVKIARSALRKEFLAADAGITGGNFAVADSGSIVIFTNEGNGRMVTTLPPLHIAVLSIEKIIPSLADLSSLTRILPRSAAGQAISSYLSIITGTRKHGEATGAKVFHIVLVDNGRSEILNGDFREILKCIRCSACLNVCPVYRVVGGHAYDSTYSGPMGIVLTALLDGMEKAHPLVDATTLCGACVEVCPVRVPLVKLLRMLRERRVDKGFTPSIERKTMAVYALATRSPFLFALGQKISQALWPIARRIFGRAVLDRIPRPVRKTFGQRAF